MPKLAHALNRLVVVSVPAFFGDPNPRVFTLVDLEPEGLWLSGEPLNQHLAKFEATKPPDDSVATVFFPFTQIVYLFDPAQFAYLGTGPGSPAVRTRFRSALKSVTPAPAPKDVAASRPTQKNSKPRR